jgi:pimeloyl-ACP methyl ester carboxylesterase
MSRVMRRDKPAFIFVHGGFVDGSIWQLVISRLEAHDHVAQALDLPGSGASAAFATEPSPNANVTQEERTQAVVSLVEETARETGGPVVLAGQPLGGLTVTAVAEAVPDQLRAIVYISAFLPSLGTSAIALMQHPTMAGTLVPSLFLADPQAVGACRIEVALALTPHTPHVTGKSMDCALRHVSIGDLSMMVLRYGAEIVVRPEPLEGFVLLQFVLSARRRSASTGRRSPVAARAAYRSRRFERVGY